MTNAEILGNKLYELRKNANLSQEEFADKIGVSRQAVSKWERGEALPDTDNLINIVHLYQISLDELIGNTPVKKCDVVDSENVLEDNDEAQVFEDDDIYTDHDFDVIVTDDGEVKMEKVNTKRTLYRLLYNLPYPIIITVAYLLWGCLSKDGRGWAIGWTLFITIPVYYSIIDCIRHKNPSEFCYPVFVTFIYCLLGMIYNLWHPLWILFITVPIFYAITEIFDRK